MLQIDRKVAVFFLILAAIVVNQFSFLLAASVLVLAVFIHRGYQMSDLNVNFQNSNRTQTLISTLYSWSESTVTGVVRMYKQLATSGNRSSTQNFSGSRRRAIRRDYCPDRENVIHNRENIYQGSNLIQGRGISHRCPEKSNSYSPVNLSEWHSTSPSPSTLNMNKKHNSMDQHGSEMDSFSHRASPWGYSLSPQQRTTDTVLTPDEAIARTLFPSAKYNMNRDSAIFIDMKSPGFTTRLLKYHAEAAFHQPQYKIPGQLPLVHLNPSPLPSLNSRNSQKVRPPVRVRIASPSCDVYESRLFSRPDNQPEPERQSKSVVDVLREISRKRIRTEQAGNDPKRLCLNDYSSSSSSSSSPAMVNGIITEQTPAGKRPREEESSRLQKKMYKRVRSNEIYSSLSSSRNICVGAKRKVADNWSRCSTPEPLGKRLKKSPLVVTPQSTEVEDSESLEPQSHEKTDKGMVSRSSLSPPSQEISVEAQPSLSPEECHKEEMSSDKTQPPNNFHGRLFAKSLAKGTPNKYMNRRRNEEPKPWKTHRTVDADAITGEDIIRQDKELSSRRLNSMFMAIISNASTSMDSSKPDAVDGPSPKLGSSVSFTNQPEAKLDSRTIQGKEKSLDGTANKEVDKSFSPPTSNISEASTQAKQNVTTSEASASMPTFSVVQTPTENASPLVARKDKQATAEPSSPVTSTPSLISSVTSAAFSVSHPIPVTVPATSAPVSMTLTTVSPPLHSNTSSTAPSGTFGSAPTATFTVPQQPEKSQVITTPSFSFGVTSASSVVSPLAPKSGFTMPTSVPMTSPAICSSSQVTSLFTIPTSTPTVTSSSSVDTAKTETAVPTVSGGFTFGATSAVTTSSTSEFSVLKTTTPVVTFGVSNPPTSTVASLPSVVTSLPTATTTTCVSSNPLATKPSFTFGTPVTNATPATTTSTSGGFNFQFGAGSQPTPTAPKLQDAPGGFKFSFGSSKESTPLNQPTVFPMPKPPAFGESFTFGGTQGTNSQENKPMTFGTPTSLTPTLAAPASNPPSGGFNFSATGSTGAAISKPTFGFGTVNPSTGTNPPLGAPLSGGFNFSAKPAEPAAVAPAPPAPSLATSFQFGSSPPAMPAASTLQTQQQQQQQPAQSIGNPFSIGGTTEQKHPMLGGGFSFGSTSLANVPTLQSNVPAFGQPSVPTFGSPTVNPLQSPPQSNPSLFQFGSGGGTMSQPGMPSGGFNFGGAPATGVPSPGFNFNPPGPSATTPFQFGAAPLQAPAMFSIGSGSTAPRSRPRNRRQK